MNRLFDKTELTKVTMAIERLNIVKVSHIGSCDFFYGKTASGREFQFFVGASRIELSIAPNHRLAYYDADKPLFSLYCSDCSEDDINNVVDFIKFMKTFIDVPKVEEMAV